VTPRWRASSMALLAVFFLLPTTETLCEYACQRQTTSETAHHGVTTGSHCGEPSNSPSILAPAEALCDHGLGQDTATVVERTRHDASPPLVYHCDASALIAESEPRLRGLHGAPPGSSPPTTTPLILRI